MCLLAVRPGPVHGLDVFPNASGVYVSFNSPKRGKTLKYNVSAVCGEDGLYEVNWLTLRFAGNPVVPLPSMVETARILCTAGSVKWYGIHLSVCSNLGATAANVSAANFAAVGPAGR